MRSIVALVLAMCGCGFNSAPLRLDAGPDARMPDAYQCVHVQLDAAGFGDPCSTAQTALCHNELGWCIDGTCRPQCGQPLACLACEHTGEHFSDAGFCYCAP